MTQPFNKTTVQQLRKDLQAVLDKHAKDQGLESIKMGNISFEDHQFTTTLTVEQKIDEQAKSELMDKKAMRVGLPLGLYGKTVKDGSKEFVIVDINTRAPKYPLIIEDQNGRRMKGTHAFAERAI